MEIKNIAAELPWKNSLGTRLLAKIDTCVIHHTAVKANVPSYNFMLRAKGYASTHIAHGWGHIAYHYMIDRDGKIYQCFSEAEIGAHAGDLEVNKRAVAVCIDGDLSTERLIPAQLASLWGLLDNLAYARPDLPLLVKTGMRSHREVRPLPTSCPSNVVQKIVEAYRA